MDVAGTAAWDQSPAAQNLVVIMSDEHSRHTAGCYGHDLVKTPFIDGLARRGTKFNQAYTPSPVCVPARAAFAAGKPVHQIGFWDNATPYDGSVPSWHHRLRELGHEVVSIGKLHFRSSDDDNGFSKEILPMHVIEGKGDLMGLVRDDLPKRGLSWKMARLAGPGESPYTLYDRQIASEAIKWLHEDAPRHVDRPWVLFVSFVSPHFPLTAPPEHYYRYRHDPRLPMPKLYRREDRPMHPFLKDYADSFDYDAHFADDDAVRNAIAGYFGLCSFLDEQIGRVLGAIEACSLTDRTRIVYTSDHGDNLGARGLWGKSTFYEESVGVPLVVAGQGIAANREVDTPVSLLDLCPFILDCAGEHAAIEDMGIAGEAPLGEVVSGGHADRVVLSEYHGMGSTTAGYMVRSGRFKFVYYVGYPPQLFDLQEDPEELVDLAGEPEHRGTVERYEQLLRARLDPEEVDRLAKQSQAELMQRHGGREAVIARGDLGFSPAPGISPEFG